jgi:predicted ATPase/transcriptional regulator with XRE-family HTH domain
MTGTFSFGQWVQARRMALRLTQKELASAAGCSVVLVRKIEADARRPSRQVAALLAKHLQIAPSEHEDFVRCARAELAPDRLPPPVYGIPRRILTTPLTNLPAQRTTLVGRERSIAEVTTLLEREGARLVTLSGPGGVGKTRLALQVATNLVDSYMDGVWFVDLAPIDDPALVVTAIAQALGVTTASERPVDQLKAALRHKHLLLLLDNYEHVLEAAVLVSNLLAAAPRLSVLVTSRALLRLTGEHEYPVPPLALPDLNDLPALERLTQYPAVALFNQRARAAVGNFTMTNTNAAAVAAICVRLDGLPLAIELAAARLKVFTPEELLNQLEQQLVLLTGGPRDLPARQQTIRATIDWSYRLLTAAEQILFTRLGVFVGGWTLEAAEAVGGDTAGDSWPVSGTSALHGSIADLLTSLTDKSLVRRVIGANEQRRFTMLETIHEYALERLIQSGAATRLRQRHAEFFLTLAETAELGLRGKEQELWLARLEEEHSNLRTALACCPQLEGGVQMGLRLAGALCRFWDIRGHRPEARAWLEGLLAQPEAAPPTEARAKALNAAGYLAQFGETALFEESVRLARALGAKPIEAQALYNLGYCTYFRGDAARGTALLEASLALFQELGDQWGTAEALRDLAEVTNDSGDHERAQALLEQSLALSQALSDQRGCAETLCDLALTVRERGEHTRAAVLYEQSLPIAGRLKDKRIVARALRGLATVARTQGESVHAAVLSEQSLALSQDVGDLESVADVLIDYGVAAREQGDPERAQAYFQEALALYRAAEHHLEIAWALLDLARTALLRGDHASAYRQCAESLALFREWAYTAGIAGCHEVMAEIAAVQGQLEWAVRRPASATVLSSPDTPASPRTSGAAHS